jgi:hypothetical protein
MKERLGGRKSMKERKVRSKEKVVSKKERKVRWKKVRKIKVRSKKKVEKD